MLKRTLYLGYYLKKLDRKLFYKFLDYVSTKTGKSKIQLVTDCVRCVFAYNTSLLEYFQFHFYDKNHSERIKWAGTGFMYETILKQNPRSNRHLLSDKVQFASHYSSFIRHSSQSIKDWMTSAENRGEIKGKWILKPYDGQCGRGIVKVDTSKKSIVEIGQIAQSTKNDMIEPFLEQHEDLQKLSPSGLNTLRVITQINQNGGVDILGVRLRITVNNLIDNLAAGNIAVPVDENTGKIIGPGVYSDITKDPVEYHPITGEYLQGFQIPYFRESLELAEKAALFDTRNRSIGWDIAILKDGPDILEGNHDWCKLLWQLPVQKGLKADLEKYG